MRANFESELSDDKPSFDFKKYVEPIRGHVLNKIVIKEANFIR